MSGNTPTLEKGESISLRVDLKYDIASTLIDIMEERKFQTYAEAVRYCIMETKNDGEFKLAEGYLNNIQQYLNYDYVQNQERVYGVQEFIYRALDHYIEKINKNSPSILSFDVRSGLNDSELDVAMALIECQELNPAEHVTIDDLANRMGRRNTDQLKEILDEFVNRGILDRMYHNDEIYYHARKLNEF